MARILSLPDWPLALALVVGAVYLAQTSAGRSSSLLGRLGAGLRDNPGAAGAAAVASPQGSRQASPQQTLASASGIPAEYQARHELRFARQVWADERGDGGAAFDALPPDQQRGQANLLRHYLQENLSYGLPVGKTVNTPEGRAQQLNQAFLNELRTLGVRL